MWPVCNLIAVDGQQMDSVQEQTSAAADKRRLVHTLHF